MTAIKDQNQQAIFNEVREPPCLPRAVAQGEVRRFLSSLNHSAIASNLRVARRIVRVKLVSVSDWSAQGPTLTWRKAGVRRENAERAAIAFP
jgi:hypothetical protein